MNEEIKRLADELVEQTFSKVGREKKFAIKIAILSTKNTISVLEEAESLLTVETICNVIDDCKEILKELESRL